ncbi:MAG: mannosyltransferase [Bacteroidetes bacterium]|nr:mannosyltransferase [Bacteroidota bacterium]MBX7128279.1 hypothetical protein [Flavobacteriales bacterium]MCC6653898.1 mannosyltransferase [Flavobacteriales bacterium]HMU14764.1 glycosyltransferase [Flavobacteriales bacterium]HMW96268.1 glycosyltransferase [Flavobacteriales bacterium]
MIPSERIPRIIHHVWFGGKPKPAGMQKVIDGWSRMMPECEVKEWNEGTIDLSRHPWMQRMHDEGRYAFASDYARFMVLLEHGGLYLDTDVVMKKSFLPFFRERSFWSFEFDSFLSTAIIGAEPGHPLIASLLREYDALAGPRVNNSIVTEYFLAHYPDFHLNNRDQMLPEGVRVYPKEYFVVPGFDQRKNFSTHEANNHWKPEKSGSRAGPVVRRLIGDVLFFKLVNLRMNMTSDYPKMDKARGR